MYLPYFAVMLSKTRRTTKSPKCAIVVRVDRFKSPLTGSLFRRVCLLEADRISEIQLRRRFIYTERNKGYFYRI